MLSKKKKEKIHDDKIKYMYLNNRFLFLKSKK